MRVFAIARAAMKTSGLVAAACVPALVPGLFSPVAAPRLPAGPGQAPTRLWVLAEPDSIIEYDLANFTAKRTLKVPRQLLARPEHLSINSRAQILYVPPAGSRGEGGDIAVPGERVWFWDGQRARDWTIDEPDAAGGGAQAPPLTQIVRQWFLSTGGDCLFRFETRFDYRVEEGAGGSAPLRSVRAAARVWRTDIDGGRPESVAAVSSSGWCPCETGACSETCPEWEFWAPDGAVGDFFILTRVTPGQLQTTYHESLLYRRSGHAWPVSPLPQPVERFLAASVRGGSLAVAVLDGGCCGWDNEGSDQVQLLRDGKASVLYDEFARYHNHNYDVSIYPSDARLAPGDSMLAYTLASTTPVGGEVRLSSGGTHDGAELARLRTAMAALPAIEILPLDSPSRPPAVIPRAALVGWLSDRELLVVREGVLTVCERGGSTTKPTSIHVRSAADAFLR